MAPYRIVQKSTASIVQIFQTNVSSDRPTASSRSSAKKGSDVTKRKRATLTARSTLTTFSVWPPTTQTAEKTTSTMRQTFDACWKQPSSADRRFASPAAFRRGALSTASAPDAQRSCTAEMANAGTSTTPSTRCSKSMTMVTRMRSTRWHRSMRGSVVGSTVVSALVDPALTIHCA